MIKGAEASASAPIISMKPPFLLLYPGYLLQFHTRPASGIRKEEAPHVGAPQLDLKREREK